MTISRPVPVAMRNVSDKICSENQNTHFLFNNFFFFENFTFYEIMWKNIVQPDRTHMTICGMRLACWIPKAPHTLSEYVLFTAFPLQ